MLAVLQVREIMDIQSKAFEFAQDSVKLMITLATGIITLTITFSKDFLGPNSVSDLSRHYALLSWVFFLASVGLGLWTLFALTGCLGAIGDKIYNACPSIYGKNITIPAILQIICFFLGLFWTVMFGIIALH
jgi:hypothetical protein